MSAALPAATRAADGGRSRAADGGRRAAAGSAGGRGRPAGVTLVELLVTLALAALVLLVLASYVGSARRAQQANEVGSEAGLTLQLAVELLREELFRVGSAPWPLPGAVEGAADPAAFMAAPLQVQVVGGGSALRLRYLDDGLAGPVVARDHTYEAAPDGRGVAQLYRRSGSGGRQPLVEGVSYLAVTGGIDASGHPLGGSELAGRRVRALWLVVRAHGEERRALVELPAQPRVGAP